jgi:hypothetical protein
MTNQFDHNTAYNLVNAANKRLAHELKVWKKRVQTLEQHLGNVLDLMGKGQDHWNAGDEQDIHDARAALLKGIDHE